jgi:pimeloyl-ACP methyl ester carboxylesterase
LLCVGLAALLLGCAKPPMLSAPPGVELTPLRTVSTIQARALIRLAGVKDIEVEHAIDCYRMTYRMSNARGEVEIQSGLLALPHDAPPRRLVSFQHGTTTTRTAVPSQLDGTGLATAIVFAGNGYALVVPDYPGLGESAGRHPYYVAERIAPAVVAMIEAAAQIERLPNAPVLLAGFSEGGWASLAALRLLEANGRAVLGSAQVAGAYDLRHVSLPAALKGGAPSHSLYLAYAAWGQSAHYGERLESALTPEYAALVDQLFTSAKPKEIVGALPSEPRKMFNRAFLDAFDQSGGHWMLDSFVANSLIDVTPKAPVRLYYGSKDADVMPDEALRAARAMQARGANVMAVDVGEVGHDASMLAAAPLILQWFRELEAGK